MKYSFDGTEFEIETRYIEEPPVEIEQQLDEYFSGERKKFDLTVSYPDSFTGVIMKAVSGIPRGETRSYSEVAEKISSAPIAVGQGLNRNPVPVIVPCHRVVGKNSLGGYKYDGVKEKLLEIEGVQLDRIR